MLLSQSELFFNYFLKLFDIEGRVLSMFYCIIWPLQNDFAAAKTYLAMFNISLLWLRPSQSYFAAIIMQMSNETAPMIGQYFTAAYKRYSLIGCYFAAVNLVF